ncbi:MAG: ATP-dependent sacrificial sulfur transferase LarE [Eubacterium sp.]|nr:ATP-dependent sacrificial sulfur transferase LarE [Eubacterium sp.]
MDIIEKQKNLENSIKNMGKVAVAFSSGVDSTFLLKTAHAILGENCVAITARGCCFPKNETQEAEDFCKKEGIKQIIIDYNPLEIREFSENAKERCYFCKKALFSKIKEVANGIGISNIIEGTNFDDLSDFRPGMKAVKELNILSPLLRAELTKDEIRALSREAGLPTFDKPSYACLASRIPCGDEITKEKLQKIEKAESKLLSLGFRQMRVRLHGNLARIEVERKDFEKLLSVSTEINSYFREIGFDFVSMDLGGYRTGNMNI